MKRNTILTRLSAEFCQCLFSIGETFCLGAAALAAEKLAPFARAADPAPGLLNRKIPSSGEPLPVIGLGTWQAFDVGRSQDARAPLAEVLGAFAEQDSMRKFRADPIDLMQVRDNMKAAFGPLPDEKLRARVAVEAI